MVVGVLDSMVHVQVAEKACNMAPLVVDDILTVNDYPVADDTSVVGELLLATIGISDWWHSSGR